MGILVRRILDRLYDVAGFLAGLFLVLLLAIIVAQIVMRWLAVPFPGSTDYAGYCMAAASFLALAHTFRRGAHIRVELVLQRLTGPAHRVVEIVAHTIATGLAWYFAAYAIKAVQVSRMLGDVSQGQDATPLWVPQLGMAVGTVLFAVALTDGLIGVLLGQKTAKSGELPPFES